MSQTRSRVGLDTGEGLGNFISRRSCGLLYMPTSTRIFGMTSDQMIPKVMVLLSVAQVKLCPIAPQSPLYLRELKPWEKASIRISS